MCVRPDRYSVSASARALGAAAVTGITALGALLLALVAAPTGLVRQRKYSLSRPESIDHIDVQVLLEEPHRVDELRRTLHRALQRAARTWAPLRLPIDRVVAGIGLPHSGRVDVYENFPRRADAAVASEATSGSLVVVTLGVNDGEHHLELAEIVGVLSFLIQAVIDERYPHRSITPIAADLAPTGSASAPLRVLKPAPGTAARGNGQSRPAVPPRGSAKGEAEGTIIAFKPDPLGPSANGQTD